MNQDETDIDCGGRICGIKCSLNKTCRKDGDCTTGFCRLNDKTCQSISIVFSFLKFFCGEKGFF